MCTIILKDGLQLQAAKFHSVYPYLILDNQIQISYSFVDRIYDPEGKLIMQTS